MINISLHYDVLSVENLLLNPFALSTGEKKP